MTPNQAKHLRELVIEQAEAERDYGAAQVFGDPEICNVAGARRTLAARRVTEYIDLLTQPAVDTSGLDKVLGVDAYTLKLSFKTMEAAGTFYQQLRTRQGDRS